MATATFSFTPNATLSGSGDARQRTIAYYGTITFSAATDTYATGGLAPATTGTLALLGPYADRTPLSVRVYSNSGSGWQYAYNISGAKLLIFSGAASADATTAEVQFSNGTALNGATPSIATDVVAFEAVFPRV